MTPIQRRACLSLHGISYGRLVGHRSFGKAMESRGECSDWRQIELTDRQLWRLARHIRKFRRQIGDDHLLFWAQRVLADATLSLTPVEE